MTHIADTFWTTAIWCEVKVILANLGETPFPIARSAGGFGAAGTR